MNIQEMVDNYNANLIKDEEPITFSEMCVQMRAKGITLSHADTSRAYIEDLDAFLVYLETKYAKLIWTDNEIEKMKQLYLDHRAFWQNEFDKCKPSDVEIARQADNLLYTIEHKLGTEEQRQNAIDRFIERVTT